MIEQDNKLPQSRIYYDMSWYFFEYPKEHYH